LGVGELIASWVRRDAGPFLAVGSAVVDLTPRPVKDLAIQVFGPADKLVLLGGVLLALALLGMFCGQLAARRLPVALAVIIVLGVIGAIAAVTRPDAGFLAAVPSLLGTLSSGLVLVWLSSLTKRREQELGGRGEDGQPDSKAAAPARTRTESASDTRRRLLIAGGVVGAGAVGSVVLGRWLSVDRYGASRSRAAVRIPAPVSTAPRTPEDLAYEIKGLSRFTTPNSHFYRVDTALAVPQVPAEEWQLRIHGMVDRPMTMTFRELLDRPLIERDITLACVSNEVGGPYVGNARWTGVRLEELLKQAKVAPEADQVVSRSHDGMTIGTPTSAVMDGRDAMLAVAMNGEPLPLEHGFPVRMVVPGLYGYVSACKWIVEMELTTFQAYDAYWTKQGWAERAEIKTASRIDTPRDGATRPAGELVVAGVAWAQHRGISRVELQVDDGPWRAASLGESTTADTWRQWWRRVRLEPGERRLRVRATDGDGQQQPSERRAPYPDGATGWHEITVTVAA
ncbi:MAG: molybdopterin-dependent oxidoreductase, partial [Micromonosporaceae bacterium]